jgi:MFS family permease
LPKQPAFQRFWCTRILSSLSFQMLAVAMGWHIYALTHSAFALGLVGLAQFLPMFVLTLVVGHVADRYDRRRIAAICQSLESVAALLFAVGTFGGWISAPVIYVLAACVGAARAFESPAVASLLPGVVPRGQLPKATAWATSANQTAQIAGPALGGLLYGIGPGAAYLACTLSFAAAATAVWGIPLRARPANRAPVTLDSVFSGIAFIRKEPVILGALSLDLFAVLFGGATALLPVFARDILHTGPLGLGLLRSGTAIGALAGTIWLAHFPLRNRPGDVRRRDCVWRGHGRVRSVASVLCVTRRAHGAGRVGHHQRGSAPVARTAAHAGRNAGARQRGQFAFHRDVESIGRIRIRCDGGVVGRAAGCAGWRCGDYSGCSAVDALFPGTQAHALAGA